MKIKKIAVMFSGKGTNLENIIKKLHNQIFNNFKIEIALTITDNKSAYGVEISKKYSIKNYTLDYKNFNSRESFDKEIVSIINKNSISLTVLAGYMKILTKEFTNNIKAINIHPSILPKYKGLNAIERSFKSGDKFGGATVHYVNSELDSGDIIIQKSCKIDNKLKDFENSVHKIEYEIFPKAIIDVLSEKSI